MRLVPALAVALALASCTARETTHADRIDSPEGVLVEGKAPHEPVRYLFVYDLEFLIAPAEEGSMRNVVGCGRLTVEMDYGGRDVGSIHCRLFGFDQPSVQPDAVDLPEFHGEYKIDVWRAPNRWHTSFNPLAIDHELRIEFPALSGDVDQTEGTWSFTTLGGTAQSGPLVLRRFLLKCPGVWGPAGS